MQIGILGPKDQHQGNADGWHPGGEAQRYRIHDDEQGDMAAGTVSHALDTRVDRAGSV